ncbi:MAG: hypothetical protein IKZ74_02395 [Clostridiales bacterium]|nr:hypothetical protein [Clostridiales bacterium]
MKIRNKRRIIRTGSIVLEATLTFPLFLFLLLSVLSSMTVVNADLYMQRATENVVSELNVAIPLVANGISTIDDIVSEFGLSDSDSIDTSGLDEALGVLGGVSGTTGVDLEDVLSTGVFGRYVRDRIVNEFVKLTDNGWVYNALVKNVSVYLDVETEDRSVFLKVYYDIDAGALTLSRSYCSSLALYADMIPLRAENEREEVSNETVWDLDNFDRGVKIRERFGGNLPYNYPVICYSSGNEVKSVKSLDGTSPYYASRVEVNDKVKKYIRDLSDFDGSDFSGVTVTVDEYTKKTLIIVVPENCSDKVYGYIEDLHGYAQQRNVDLCIEKYEISHRYDEKDTEI